MPKLKAFRLAGLELWFYSQDHLPPHFHVERGGEWQVRVYFMRVPEKMVDVVYSFRARRPSKADLKTLKQKAHQHRMRLLAEWEEKVR